MSNTGNNKRPILIIIILVLLAGIISFAVLRFTGRNETPKPGSGSMSTIEGIGPDAKRMEQKPIKAKPVESPGQLVISSSAETGPGLYASWPLIISASIWRKALIPDDQGKVPAASPITLKTKTGSWQEALVIEVKNETGSSVTWPFHAVNPSGESLTLDVDDTAEAIWYLEPSETASLAPGQYTITASFDSSRIDGLPAYVATDRFHLKIEKEPASLEPVSVSEKQLQTANISMLKNDPKTAGEIADQILAKDPENIEGLRLKSRILAKEGKPLEALAAVNKALEIYRTRNPEAYDPPFGILHQRSEILKDMAPPPVKNEGSPPSN